jgi:hypothetical protein
MSWKWKPEFVQRREKARQQKQDADRSAENVAALNELKQAYIDTHKEDRSNEWWQAFRAYLTIALVLTTVGFTGLTYWVFKQQLDVSRDTEQRQLRAYISIEDFGADGTDSGQPVFSYKSHNVGLTPAHDVRFFAWIGVLPYPLPKNFPHDDVRENTTVSQTTIGTGVFQRGRKIADAPLTTEQKNAITDGSSFRLYFMGVARYKDAFEKSHETWFCINVGGATFRDFAAQTASAGVAAHVGLPAPDLFTYCDQMNDAD